MPAYWFWIFSGYIYVTISLRMIVLYIGLHCYENMPRSVMCMNSLTLTANCSSIYTLLGGLLAPTALDPSLYLALRARLQKYGDDVRRRPIVPCTVPVCYRPICRKVVSAGAATAAGWSHGAGCLDSYLRMISSRSATAVNGSQLARWLYSLLSLGI